MGSLAAMHKRQRSRRSDSLYSAKARQAVRQGRRDGYDIGRKYGYHLGRCDAMIARYSPSPVPVWDVHLFYVKTGLGVPYAPIDEAIVGNLSKMVARLTVVSADTPGIAELAIREKPDAVLVLNGMNFKRRQLEKLRHMGMKTALWLTNDPYFTDATVSFAPLYDYVFTLELGCVSYYQKMGCKEVFYLPFANDFRIFRPKSIAPSKRCDILFIGSGYWNRINFFDSIAPYLSDKKAMIAGWWWDRLQNYHLISDKIKLGLWMTPEQTAEYYNGAKIVINLHRATDGHEANSLNKGIAAHSMNMRTFEIAGSGVLQLSDIRLDLHNHYQPGSEIATYESPEELIGKIDYYLHNENERLQIARRGLRRTLIDHTYEKRLQTLLAAVFPQ